MKEARDRVDGTTREDEIIDLNNMVKLDEYGNIDMDDELNMNKFSLEEGKKLDKKKHHKKYENDGMDLDDEVSNKKGKNVVRKNKRKNKKTKSYYIVNF